MLAGSFRSDSCWNGKRSFTEAMSAPFLKMVATQRSSTDCCTAVKWARRMPSFVGWV